ncbi:hypothetical protein [Saccharothrix longispora]|uniref:hypothetical protein n=1 Tax=Saccharothrix longispora TaxID=33920 RepID=UPI0028FD6F5C|nr:hypothetical protein [Saccharothrix longispora]MDU0294960.1 hypothetical protein [Saccharothrix longispora]
MATPEEIRLRIEQADTARSARRATAAQQIGELAQRRAAIIEQLEDIERELGDILAEAQDVIGIDELAEFTDLKPADLTAWLAGRKTGRGKRRKTTGTTGAPLGAQPGTHRAPGTGTSAPDRTRTPRETQPLSSGAADDATEHLVARAS